MRDLDSRSQQIMKNIDEKASDLLKAIANTKENMSDETKKERIKSTFMRTINSD